MARHELESELGPFSPFHPLRIYPDDPRVWLFTSKQKRLALELGISRPYRAKPDICVISDKAVDKRLK